LIPRREFLDTVSLVIRIFVPTPLRPQRSNLEILRSLTRLIGLIGRVNGREMLLATILLLGLPGSVAADEPLAPTVSIPLKRGLFGTYHFAPRSTPRALLIFASGDGGWGRLENRVCTFLEDQAVYVVGIDCNKYAETDYDSATLVADFAAITEDALERAKNRDLPIIYGGWSMGAVQALAAAGDEKRPENLVGLLLLSMGKRGRFGLRLPERVGLEPEGAGTFGVADFTGQVGDLRLVQFEALGDWMSNTDWIKSLKSTHRLFELENSNHDFNGADEASERDLLEAVSWILDPAKSAGDRPSAD
jgi:phosphatidylglycerol lysyltransferase